MLSVITYILPPVRNDCQKDTKEETMEEEYFLHINWFASSDDHLQVWVGNSTFKSWALTMIFCRKEKNLALQLPRGLTPTRLSLLIVGKV